MANSWQVVPLGKILKRADRFEKKDELQTYHFAGTYSFARGIFAGAEKEGSSFGLDKIQRIHKGDFIYCKIMAWEGAFGIAPEQTDNCVMSGAFVVYEIDQNKVEPKFLEYYFKQEPVWKTIGSQSTGTNVRRRSLHPNQFEKATIPLPPLTEQRRIVVRIEALAARVAEAQSLRREVYEELDAFVSSYHVTYSADRKVRLKDILFLDEERIPIQANGIYPQVGVKGFGKGLFARETLDGTQTTYKWFNHLYYGAIVLSQVKGWEGAIGVCDESLAGKYVSPEYRTFRCIPEQAIPEYLNVLFSTPFFYSKLKDLTRGVGGRRERIRPELFIELEIPMPDIQRQKKAVEIFAKFPALRTVQAETEKELSALMPSVLDRAFKGEL